MTNTSSVQVVSKPYVAPRNATEESLVAMLSEILKVDSGRIGVDDGLFEPGGRAHSLAIVQLIARIADQFKVEILIRDVFAHPTISQLALIIEKNKCADLASEVTKF